MSGVLNEGKKGLIFVISAPAGTGKTTLVKKLVQEFPSILTSISYTTRMPRANEIPGVDYHFISKSDFEDKIVKGDFIEYVTLYTHYYGTSKEWIENRLAEGKHIVLVIDTQGALKLKTLFPAIYIFIQPPSLEVLQNRLFSRKTESVESIQKRVEVAREELTAVQHYDYLLINDDLNIAYQVLRSIFIAESHRIARWLDE